jgi:hypothetical protein
LFRDYVLFPRPLERVVSLRRTEIELTVERALPFDPTGPARVARMATRYALPPDASAPTDAELAEAFAELVAQLDRAVALLPQSRARPDRELSELIDTYRPRQPELIDLLREEGELTTPEYELLKAHLLTTPREGSVAAPPLARAPISARPLSNDRTTAMPRAVSALLTEYQITSLKQAGAVRARRQISYDEYMALKRHFTASEENPPAATPS